jgi:hypothetical protein
LSGGSSGGRLSDWITAIAGWAAVLAYRRVAKRDFPIIEPYFGWSTEGGIGPHIRLQLAIRNRLDETLVISECKIKKPKGSTISMGTSADYFGIVVPSKGSASRISLNYEISPSGTSFWAGGEVRGDNRSLTLFLCPPDDWRAGKIVVRLLISSRSSTIRDKRIVIKRRLTAANDMQTDAKASK